MHITIFTVLMTFLWSSLLIVLFYLLRKNSILLDVCSVSGVVLLYLFCILRLAVPVEFPWSRMVYGGKWYNFYNDLMQTRVIGEMLLFHVLALLWLAVAVIFLVRLAFGYRKLLAYYKGIPKEKDELAETGLKRLTGTKKRIPEVVKTVAVKVPCCFGIFKKRILIPTKPYTEEEMHFILLHEYSHLKNNDTLIKLLTDVLCALYWWNPLVYLLKNDLDQSLEIRCDQMVIYGMDKAARAKYLEILLAEYKDVFAEGGNGADGNRKMTQLLETHPDRMIERFRQIEGKKRMPEAVGKLLTVVLAMGLLVLSYSFVFQSRYECPEEEILTTEDAKEIFMDQGYIVHKKDGTYLLYLDSGVSVLKEDCVELLVQDGVPLVEEK